MAGALALCALIGGCAGRGAVHVIPINLNKITVEEPLVQELVVDRCYFWVDDQGELCIAMAGGRGSIRGDAGRQSTALSLVLEGMPAGESRSYRVGQRHLRMIAKRGAHHHRWASLAGVAAVWYESEDRLRGRFRIMAKQQQFLVTTSWRGDVRSLVIGEFVAQRRAAAGRTILLRTEADGMEREARPE